MKLIFHIIQYDNRQVANIFKALANCFSKNIKLSKVPQSKTIRSRGLRGRLLGPLIKIGLSLKNALTPLPKCVLVPLGLTATSAADAVIHKKILGSRTSGSVTTTLIVSNEEMRDIMQIAKSLEPSDLSIKGITETTENETKE